MGFKPPQKFWTKFLAVVSVVDVAIGRLGNAAPTLVERKKLWPQVKKEKKELH